MTHSEANFYQLNIDTPLSLALGSPVFNWEGSILGQLGKLSENSTHLREIPFNNRRARLAWRVVDAYYLEEDGILSYFKAFSENGSPMPHAAFGVNWGSVPYRIAGRFMFRPEFNNQYYVPTANNFPTPEAGGYTVQVLDMDWPSEGLSFGLYKQRDHQALMITFRLLPLGPDYPHDFPGPPR
jgi:hypothetical protein